MKKHIVTLLNTASSVAASAPASRVVTATLPERIDLRRSYFRRLNQLLYLSRLE